MTQFHDQHLKGCSLILVNQTLMTHRLFFHVTGLAMAHARSLVMAQEPVRCELCTRSTGVVNVYCNTCNVKLCKSCMPSHVSQGHRSHDMVEYAYHGSNTLCGIHSGIKCDMRCQQCQIAVCTKCIISGLHKNHDFTEISGESYELNSVSISGSDIPQSSDFLHDTVVVMELDTNCADLNRIGICHPDKIWASFMYEGIMSCLDFSGAIKDSISVSSGEYPADIFVTREKELYFCDWKGRTINRQNLNATNRDIDVVLKMEEWTPRAICVSKSGNLLVCMTLHYDQCKIIQYSGKSIIREIQFDENGDAMFHHKGGDIFVTENGNGDICVSLPAHRSVQVVSNVGDFRYSYHGNTDSSTSNKFSPHGITTDRLRQVLIADSENNRIHCIDVDGHFIKFICCGLVDPRAVQVNTINSNLYVGEFSTGKIKIIKYIQ